MIEVGTHREAAQEWKPRALSADDALTVRMGGCLCGSFLRLTRGPGGYSGRNYLCLVCHREFHVAHTTVLLLHELCPDERVKEIYKL